jgi:hypothetical protein
VNFVRPEPVTEADLEGLEPHIAIGADLTRKFKSMLKSHVRSFHMPDDAWKSCPIQHKIELKPHDRAPSARSYRLSEEDAKQLAERIEEYLAKGWIIPSNSAYSSPVLFAVKKGTTQKRFCVDYRKINALTKREEWPMPHATDLFDRVAGSPFLSSLDIENAFFHIPLTKESQEYTTFVTDQGRFCFTITPFGCLNGSFAMQKLSSTVLRDCSSFCCVFIDDILIWSKTAEEHLQHIDAVLQRLRDNALSVKLKKCKFFCREVEYLGHMISSDGVRTCKSLTDKVLNWPVPKNVKDVQRFLGLAQYYSRFVHHYAAIASPLTSLLKKGQAWQWGDAERRAFDTLKEALCCDPVLKPYDPRLPTFLETDASQLNVGLGAVLCQVHPDGPHPVAYMSKKLSRAERAYEVHDLEMLAIIVALKKWRHYVISKHIPVYTDHAGLQYLLRQPHLNLRQVRWLSTLADYDVAVHYKPGKQNAGADSLSRRPGSPPPHDPAEGAHARPCPLSLRGDVPWQQFATQPAVCTSQDIPEAAMNCALSESFCQSSFVRRCVEAYDNDAEFAGPYHYIKSGSRNAYLPEYDLYSIDAGTGALMYNDGVSVRVCVPHLLRQELIHEFHDTPLAGHMGHHKVHHALRKYFYWKYLSRTVQRYIGKCDLCQRAKDTTRPSRMPTVSVPPPFPFHTLHLDFWGDLPVTPSGYNFVMSVQCALTKRVIFIPCRKSLTGRDAARYLFSEVVRHHGVPLRIISDRDPRFMADFWRSLFRELGTRLSFTFPYDAKPNGSVERVHRTLGQALRCFCEKITDWQKWLHLLEFSINNTVNEATGHSPFYLDMGRHPMTPGLVNVPANSHAPPSDPVAFVQAHSDVLAMLVTRCLRRASVPLMMLRVLLSFQTMPWAMKCCYAHAPIVNLGMARSCGCVGKDHTVLLRSLRMALRLT